MPEPFDESDLPPPEFEPEPPWVFELSEAPAEPGPPAGPELALPPEDLRPPRLGIIHLLGWTAATAVLLGFGSMGEKSFREHVPDVPAMLLVARDVIRSLQAALGGAGVVGGAIVLMAKLRGQRGRLQPGHWAVAAESAFLVPALIFWAIWLLLGRAQVEHQEGFEPTFLVFGAIVGVKTAGYGLGCWRIGGPARWRVCLGVVGGVTGIGAAAYCAAAFGYFRLFPWAFGPWSPPLIGIVLLVTVLLEWRRGRPRDWVHWLGVGVLAMNAVLDMSWWGWSQALSILST